MSGWLAGARLLQCGEGGAVRDVAESLAAAGARIYRSAIGPGGEDVIAQDFDAAEAALGGSIDLLLHGGSSFTPSRAESIDLAAWRASVSADIDRRFLQSAEFARRCIAARRYGSILYLMPGLAQAPGRFEQATAYGALENLVKSLAVEWARDGIRINAIASRACEAAPGVDPALAGPLGNLSAYLLSDYAAYVSGTIMGVDEI
jgi:NAD(P)-dependent dehydrogenase (short-subunit alcohol dehydrogenase family)